MENDVVEDSNGTTGGVEHQVLAVKQRVTAAYTVKELISVLKRNVLPLVQEEPENGEEKAIQRPVTRALCLILAEVAFSATCNDYKAVLTNVRQVIKTGLRNSQKWPLLPEVWSAVLTASLPRCTHGDARVAALRLWDQLIEFHLSKRGGTADPSKSELVTKAISAQATILEGLAHEDEEAVRETGIREVQRLWNHSPKRLPQVYKDRLTASGGATGAYWLISALVRFYRSHLAQAYNEDGAKKEFLELYLREAINAKTKPGPLILASFEAVIASVTDQDVVDILQPSVEKALKKSPAGVLEAVASLAAQLPLDLGRYVDALFLPPALRMVKSVEEEPRMQAVQLLGTLASKVSDPMVLAKIVTEVTNVLLGKSGVLAQWFQRQATVTALRALGRGARHLPRASVAASTSVALEGLVTALGKEAHEGTRAEILAAMGEWLGLVEGGVPSVALEALKKGLSGTAPKEAVLPLLLAIRDAIAGAPGLREQLKELNEPLTRIVKEGVKRTGQANLEALIAFHGLIEMGGGALDPAAAKHLTETTSWLYAPAVLEALANPTNGPAAFSLVKIIFAGTRSLGAAAVLGPRDDFTEDEALGVRNVKPATLALVDSLLNISKAVRTESEAVVKAVLQDDATISLSLLKALWVKVDGVAGKLEEASKPGKDSNGIDDDSSTKKERGWPCPQRFASALKAAVPDGSASECLPMALVLAHHPVVADSLRKATALWSRLVSCLGGTETICMTLDHVSVDISDEVLQAILSENRNHRLAGQRSLGALADSLGDEGRELLAEGIVPALLIQLQRPELLELSPLDISIFFHPAGSVYQTSRLGGLDKSGGSGAGADAKAAANRRMRTGRRGQVYDTEDEKWEEEYKKKKAAEKSGGAAAGPSPEEGKLLAEEAEVRAKVGGIRREALAVLEVLEALSRLVPAIAHAAIPEALQALTPLLASRLLDAASYSALRALATCVEANAQPVAWDLAAGVRLVAVEEKPEVLGPLSDVLGRCIDYLSGCCSDVYKERLSGPTFALLFPILRAVLMDIAPGPSYFDALAILSAHANLAEAADTPPCGIALSEAEVLRPLRRPMIEVILYVLKAHPRSDPEPGAILINLLMGPALSVGEWTPLLGNTGILSEESLVRLAVLEAIESVAASGNKACLSGNPLLESRLWIARQDEEVEVAEAGDRVWSARGAELSALYAAPLLVLLAHESKRVRGAAAKALAAAVVALPDTATATLNRLLEVFKNNAPAAEKNEDPRASALFLAPPGTEDPEGSPEQKASKEEEKAAARSGVAQCLEELGKANALSPDGPDKHLEIVFPFLLSLGVIDPNDTVRQQMVSAGMALIDAYGANHAGSLLPIFEGVLETPAGKGEDLQAFDFRREGTVVLMGSTAKHLDKSDPKILAIMDRLIDALSTPSGPVQRAVALCMVPLMPAAKANAGDMAAKLLNAALKGDSYGTRRGAAYGISALVKGLGIASLKQHGIMSALEQAAGSSNVGAKQGALFCFECLCDRLRLLFEPYVIVILPLLLKCFSDPSDHVRDAAGMAAKAIMGNLSPHGVKLVLPTILKALDDSAWRSKAAALSLLGSMAYCAPKQLSSCLPQIVPRMTEAFGDTHPKVRESGKTSLADIGNVIRNPEIRKLSPLLLSALFDPAKHTKEALDGLLSCEFMHSVDAPSLALLIPIIQRGLKDRAADLKRKSSLITGNMCSMVSDARDLVPYLPALLPGLKAALVDPIPDVRATAARALGSSMRGMGEESLFDLVPWLIETLKTEASSVERSGGAQGLAQVLVSLGDARVAAVLGDLLALRCHPRFSVREGVLWVLSFLPPALGPGFTPYLGDSLPVILSGLTDEVESVREVALRAGQVLVSTHGKHHSEQLLPSLEAGLFDDSWRIRQSSVQLLGDLLYTIGGTKAIGLAMDADEEEGSSRGTSRAELAINTVLGPQRRAKILASLYVIRSDTSAVVRQSALQVWKTVVSNTPRVLREVLPTLIEILISALASNNYDKRTVAGRALGDIVKKLGDQILPEIVPHLRHELSLGDTNMRQGVCLGLAEIMDCAQKKQIEEFASTLVEAIIDALSDPSASVREQAGQAFLAFHRILGSDAIVKVVPPMLDRLEEEQAEAGEEDGRPEGRALLGVRELLRARPRDVLGYLLPKLTKPPVSISHARTLEAVAEVTGASLHIHASTLIPLLILQMIEAEQQAVEEERRLEALKSCTRTIVTSVESSGMQHLVVDLAKLLEAPDAKLRRWGTWSVCELSSGSGADIRPQAPILLKYLIPLLNDTDEAVWPVAVSGLRFLLDRLGVEESLTHMDFMRNVAASVVSDARRRKGGIGDAAFALPGLNVPGGLDPFMPVYTHGLLQGIPHQKEVAASWMGELIDLMTSTSLRPYIAKIVGPLIRIVSDKSFPPNVKSAILSTMSLLLEKGGPALRGLAPQLQTTFTKALSDPVAIVRERASTGLGRLVPLSTRIDPLVTELMTGAVGSPAGLDVQTAMCKALARVLAAAGDKVSAPLIAKVVDQLCNLLGHDDQELRVAASIAVGRAIALVPDDNLQSALHQQGGPLSREAGGQQQQKPNLAQGRALALNQVLRFGGGKMTPFVTEVLAALKNDVGSKEHSIVREAGVQGLSGLVLMAHAHCPAELSRLVDEMVGEIAIALVDNSEDVRKAGAALVKHIAKSNPAALRPHHVIIIPPLLEGVKDMNIRVKYVSERALLYALEIHTRAETLNEFIAKAPMEPAKFVRDYARRVLVRLTADSDDEEEEEEEGGKK